MRTPLSRNFTFVAPDCLKSAILSVIIILAANSAAMPQNYNWITPNMTYLKLYVAEDATYRISKTDFINAGINADAIDPRTVKLYNKGVEQPVCFTGEADGIFDASDYFDFYGTRNYGGLTKYYTVDNTVYYSKDEYYSLYSDTNVYWVSWDGANGQRLQDFSYVTDTLFTGTTFTERVHFEKDKLYSQGERGYSEDYRYFNNELFQGEGWYWSSMYTGLTVSETFSTPFKTPDSVNCTLKFFAYPADINTSVSNEHRLIFLVNNTVVSDMSKNDFARFDATVNFPSTLLSSSSVNTVTAYYLATGYDGHTYLDFMQIKYPKLFRFENRQLSADLSGSDTTSKVFRIPGLLDQLNIGIYDFRNNLRITQFSFSGDTLIFTAKSNAKLEIFNKRISKKPVRMHTKQVADLVSPANSADYILVYNPLFTAQAQQLIDHRAGADGFRVKKADIYDIYDIFNYGIESPLAVRLFAKHAYENWQGPAFTYLCLFGRGSSDPKKNAASTIYSKNLIPVYGYPTTDSYFGNFSIGAFTYLEKVAVGRLPAYTTAEAQAMVDNIVSYDNQGISGWWKNSAFVVGGGTYDEQSFYQSLINPFISNYIESAPMSGFGHRIFRNDYTTTVTYNYKDSVRRDINNGTMLVSFLGHAGNSNWEDAMQEPSSLDNYGKFPFVLSMTCYTGRNSEPAIRIFGEKFVTMNNRGAIGFLGSTGWGFVYSGNQFQDWMLRAFTKDTLRRTGDIVKYGKKKISYDSLGSVTRHTVNCYALLGDPAAKLAMPVRPEFKIDNSDYRLTDNFPSLNQTVTLTALPKNFGLHADSCKIGFTLLIDNSTVLSRDTVLRAFRFSDSARFTFRLDSIQNYSVRVELDKDNWHPLENKDNNVINIDLPLRNNSFVPLVPVRNAVIETDTLVISGLNPRLPSAGVKVVAEIDTASDFTSPFKITFVNDNVSGPVSRFSMPAPAGDTNRIYFWRTNAIISGDSAGWTTPWAFTCRQPIIANSGRAMNERAVSSVFTKIRKISKSQYPPEEMTGTASTDTGLVLAKRTLNLYVRSMGSSGAEISNFSVNDKAINIDGGRSPGLSMLKVKKLNGLIVEYKNFKLLSTSSMDSVVNFLNTFDTTFYLMALNASYVDYNLVQQLNEATKAKIRSFGSTKIDSMYKFGYFDTWSFIGHLGAGPQDVSEQYFKYAVSTGWRESQSSLTRSITNTAGSADNTAGPSSAWTGFSWKQTIAPQSGIFFDVLGIDNSGNQILLMQDLTSNEFVDLSGIDARTYPGLNLKARPVIDTVSGYESPVLRSIEAGFQLPAELVLDNMSLALNDSSARAGSEAKIEFNCINAGYLDIEGLVANVYLGSISPANLIQSDTLGNVIMRDSAYTAKIKYTVPYSRPGADGRIYLFAEILPAQGQSEFQRYNNSAKFSLILKDVSQQFVSVFCDNKLIRGGEFVSLRPEIRIEFSNNRQSFQPDIGPNGPEFLVNGISVSGSMPLSDKRAEISGRDAPGRVHAGNVFHPVLNKGTNRLTVKFVNPEGVTDSAGYDVTVSDILRVLELNNYPNPMKDRTSFMFDLSSSENAVDAKIKIYTIAGRLIRELRAPVSPGMNQIEWDGRDSDGDAIANGVYLYKLVAEDGSGTESAMQKLVVMK